jgi:hypothetical protein
MKKALLFLCISFILVLIASCGENLKSNSSINTSKEAVAVSTIDKQTSNKNSNKSVDLVLDQEVKNSKYSISIPKSWSYEELMTSTLYFKKGDSQIGGLYIQPYYKDVKDPVNVLLPNHTEIIDSKKLTGFFTETQEIKLVTTEPAVSGDSSSENWIHIFFIKDKEVIYELFFNTKFIDENNILKIAKSFKLL